MMASASAAISESTKHETRSKILQNSEFRAVGKQLQLEVVLHGDFQPQPAC